MINIQLLLTVSHTCYVICRPMPLFRGLEKIQRERKDLTNCDSSELSFKQRLLQVKYAQKENYLNMQGKEDMKSINYIFM